MGHITKKERFRKFVQIHDKLKLKRYESNGYLYSDYDTLMGFSIVMTIISFIFINKLVGAIFIGLVILFWVLQYTEFEEIKDK